MSTDNDEKSGEQKLCFVTVGATADFSSLLEAVCNAEFLEALRLHDYTELRIQYGKNGGDIFSKFIANDKLPSGLALMNQIVVKGFDFRNSLEGDMRTAKGGLQSYDEGVIISHAGTGSILEAFRVNAPLILVPNATLLDNHQLELAEELCRQKYAVLGSTSDLRPALAQVESERKVRPEYAPVNHRKGQKTFMNVMDEEMGFLD